MVEFKSPRLYLLVAVFAALAVPASIAAPATTADELLIEFASTPEQHAAVATYY